MRRNVLASGVLHDERSGIDGQRGFTVGDLRVTEIEVDDFIRVREVGCYGGFIAVNARGARERDFGFLRVYGESERFAVIFLTERAGRDRADFVLAHFVGLRVRPLGIADLAVLVRDPGQQRFCVVLDRFAIGDFRDEHAAAVVGDYALHA